MDTTGYMVITEPPPPSLFNTSLFFNASLKLAHHFFSLPSRVLTRLRQLDNMALDFHNAAHAPQQSTGQAYRRHRLTGNTSSALLMPGPWGFLTSGYFIGLFIMAFVLNRIQNIVVPPRRPLALRIHHMHRRAPISLHRALLRRLFPVDLSSTFLRTVFRVPSIYLLGKAVAIWVSFLISVQDPSLFSRIPCLRPLGDWIAGKTMEDVCWYTFLSSCFALCVGTLTTGLEGLNINDSAPFNLFAFSFQLYMESGPHTRSEKESESLPRPNTHIIITILLPLLQLTVMHCLEITHRWSQWRLAFSSAGSALALLHFHYVLWLSDSTYPLTTYAARIAESLMLVIISVTVVLNAATQLLAEGTLSRPLFGHAALMPRRNEDFNVALFRLGTASMEATAVAGLGNEVGVVSSARPSDFAPRGSSKRARETEVVRGEIQIDRTGVSGLNAAYELRGLKRVLKTGFANEITNVRVKAASTDFWMDTVLNVAWQWHLGTFMLSAWHAAGRMWRLCVDKVKGRRVSRRRSPSVEILDGPPAVWRASSGEDADPYERFLRGEPVSDDEEEFQPGDEEGEQTSQLDSGDEAEGEDEDERAQLYVDLSVSDVASAPLLLAHMTDASSSPLTRRGYRRLVSGARRASSEAEEWDEFVLERRRAKREVREEDENPRLCVICTVEPRDIICWPCRCLALCDDCRNNLASRSSASKHTCPCCRQSVEGYSKIYIP